MASECRVRHIPLVSGADFGDKGLAQSDVLPDRGFEPVTLQTETPKPQHVNVCATSKLAKQEYLHCLILR